MWWGNPVPTKIEWTEETWNPVTGCSPVSLGCQNCYARRMANRLRGRFGYPKNDPFRVTYHADREGMPLFWKRPRHIFVCSMSDLMHRDIPQCIVAHTIQTMTLTPHHTYQVLTKRPDRLREFAWPSNCWVGVTVEHPDYLDRIDTLRWVKAPLRFVSFEPLLAKMPDLDLSGIGWVIVGGETGPGRRLMQKSWAISILQDAKSEWIPFFFKRFSTGSRLLDGRMWEEVPE